MTTQDEVRQALAAASQASHAAAQAAQAASAAVDASIALFDDWTGEPPPVVMPPTVSLSAVPPEPVEGDTVTVTAAVTVDPSRTVASVAWMADGVSGPVQTAPPYAVTQAGLTAGSHTFRAVATDSAGATGSATKVLDVEAKPPPVDGLPAPSGGDDTAAVQAFFDAHRGETITFDPALTYQFDRWVTVLDQHVVGARVKAGPEGAGVGGAHPFRNIYVWNCPADSTASFTDCRVVGRNAGGGTSDAAYDPEREAQHAWNVEGCASFTMRNCVADHLWGDGVFLGPGAGGATLCRNVDIDGVDVSATGRQGIALTGVDGFTIRHAVLHDMRRSCVDIEPLTATYGAVRNGLFEDCVFGPGRLLVMAGKGGGPNVSNVTWRRCSNVNPTGTPILQLGASDYAAGSTPRRGPFLMEDCRWDVGGSPASGFELTGVDGFTMRNCVASFPAARQMTAVTLKDSVNVVLTGCTFTGAQVRVSGDATSRWTDNGATVPVADPTVVLTVPASPVQPGTVPVSAVATVDPSRSVAKVEFFVDGVLVATDTAAPYTTSATLDTGTRVILARVTDSAGAFAEDTKSVTVAQAPGPNPPTVQVSGPTSVGSPGAVPVSATVTVDPSRTVAKVEFTVNGTVVATDTTSPYSASVTLGAGAFSIGAKVTDSSGATATATPYTCIVAAQPPPSGSWEDGTAGAVPNGTTLTVSGVKATYGGRRWVFINDTSSQGNAYKRAGYTVFQVTLSGADTSLVASQQAMSAALEQVIPAWKLNSTGFFVGHSSNAATVDKTLRNHGDPNLCNKIAARLRGIGISGVGWRTTSSTGYEKGGTAIPWIAAASKIRRVWLFTGVAHDPLNRHTLSTTEEAPTYPQSMAMILPEKWHWLATRAGLISYPYSQVMALPEMVDDPTTTYEYVTPTLNHRFTLEAQGNDWFIRMDEAAQPDGHTLVPTTMDAPTSFWQVMETAAP